MIVLAWSTKDDVSTKPKMGEVRSTQDGVNTKYPTWDELGVHKMGIERNTQ